MNYTKYTFVSATSVPLGQLIWQTENSASRAVKVLKHKNKIIFSKLLYDTNHYTPNS